MFHIVSGTFITFILSTKDSKVKTRIMTKLKDKKIIMPTEHNGRIYTIRFSNNYLLRGVVKILGDNFTSVNLEVNNLSYY